MKEAHIFTLQRYQIRFFHLHLQQSMYIMRETGIRYCIRCFFMAFFLGIVRSSSFFMFRSYVLYFVNFSSLTAFYFVLKVPKLVHQEMLHNAGAPVPLALCGLNRGSFGRLFDIFSPDSVYYSGVLQHNLFNETSELSGTFGFTRLLDLSPGEVTFLAKCSLLQRLLFSVIRRDRQLVEEILDLFMEKEGNDLESTHLDKQNIRTVTRMLLLPAKCESSLLRKRFPTGSSDAPYEALVTSHQDRFMMNVRLLRAIYAFIPRARSPPVSSTVSFFSFNIICRYPSLLCYACLVYCCYCVLLSKNSFSYPI